MDRPERDDPKPKAGWLPLLLAAGVGIMILTALVMLTGGFLGLVIVVGGGVFALAGFHYLVWGWWLSDKLYREEAAAEAREAAAAELASHSEDSQAASARKTLAKCFGPILWGLVFVLVGITVNGFDLLPDGVGFVLIAVGCHDLASQSIHFSAAKWLALVGGAVWLRAIIMGAIPQAVTTAPWLVAWPLLYWTLICGMVWELLGGMRDLALAAARPDLASQASNRRIAFVAATMVSTLLGLFVLQSHELLPWIGMLVAQFVVGVMVLQLIYRVRQELI